MQDAVDVAVVGGGVVGLWTAFCAARRGASVAVVDPEPGRGASWTAAGMLAPVTEYAYGEDALLALTLAAAAAYPAAVAELAGVSGLDAGYRATGSVEVAWDAGDLAALRDLDARRRALGLETRLLTGGALRRVEPGLATGVAGGVVAAGEAQVDNRAMVASLLVALERLGVALVREAATGLGPGSPPVVQLASGPVRAGAVVLAAGAATTRLPGLPEHLRVPVRPVQGHTLRLRTDEPVVEHVVRGRVRGTPVYVVPRASGEVVVGATSEERGFVTERRAGAVHDLLRDALLLVPGLDEAEWVEVSAGLRPGTPDNGPVVGPTGVPGLLVATGHYRNGVLLAPTTGYAVAGLLAGEPLPAELAAFGPERFALRQEVPA
ncbi:glycine oxidase [Motilibacter rhizosphaerae]|uniref:glycine oxidase n=1 Tax=Motilibacter rhizosphaerae TaxID=598652 RepID=A0A4Q7NW92_9ACTN|nr:glycine oxidase ThiO [Motilibacter rhizosphaerae]RZS91475.1 glycine oxidase [Motilibacter rhizosphaerae]